MLSVFETILEMSLTASIVILVIMLARMLLSKAPKKYAYLLWLVVAFRLCVPFSFESSLSIFNTAEVIPSFEIETSTQEPSSEAVSDATPEVSDTVIVPSVPAVPNQGTVSVPEQTPPVNTPVTPPVSGEIPSVPSTPNKPNDTPVEIPNDTPVETPNDAPIETPNDTPVEIPDATVPATPSAPETDLKHTLGVVLAVVWVIGIECMLGYGVISYIKLKKRLQTAVLLYDNVYGSDRIGSPFALGVFRPRIYIPFGLNEEAQGYILAHERYHLKRLDHLVKPLSFAILCVHWFNPLCWLAFNRMSLDMELSCDERVLKQYGDENMKKKYSKTLLDFATDNRYPTPAPISFSEGAGAKTRIKHALYWKKPRFWVSAIAILLCVVVLVACAANAVSQDPSDDNSEDEHSDRIIDFGDTPYLFTFESNGDGTCVITDILTDFDHTEPFDLVIPETSPDGDKVVEVDMNVLKHYTLPNVPTYLTAEQYDAIKEKITANQDSKRDLLTFQAYYESYEPAEEKNKYAFAYYRLEPKLYYPETLRLSEILARCADYTAAECYQDASAFSDLLSHEEQTALREELFRHLYHDASNIAKVVLPNADTNVHQGFLGLSYFTADGTEVEPSFENPVRLDGAEDDAEVDLYDEDAIYEIAQATTITFERSVQDFSFIALNESEVLTYVGPVDPKQSGLSFEAGATYTVKTYFNDVTYNRGIAFRGEDNKMHYYGFAIDLKDGGPALVLTDITDSMLFPIELSVRYATEEDQANNACLRFKAPELPVSYELVIETNRMLLGLNVCKFDATDYSDEDGWLYTAEPFDRSFGSFSEDTPLLLTVYPESITSTYGIFFREKNGTLRYFAIFENELDGEISLVEITDRVFLPQFPGETVIETYEYSGGTLYHTKRNSDGKHTLHILYQDGTVNEISTLSNIANIKLNQSERKLIWNDFPGEYCSFWVYDFAGDISVQHTVGVDYAPSYMDWYDDRYFLFVRQSTHSPTVRGGDVYVYDTTDRNQYPLFDAETEGTHEIMISSFASDGQNLTLVGYVYNHETAQYTDWSYTVTTDAVYDLITNYETVTLAVKKEIPDPPSPLYGETLIESYRFDNGYVFLTYNEEQDLQILRAMYDDGGVDYIHEDECFSYRGYNAKTQQLIWNDYGKNNKTCVYLYDARIDKLYKNITGHTDVEYSVTFLKWFDDQHFLYAREPVQGVSAGDGDLFLYDAQGFGSYPIIDAQGNLIIKNYENGRILAVNLNEEDGTYTMMFYMLSEAEIIEMIGIESKWRTLRADDCIAMLDCPVEVVPTDKEPTVRFDGDASEVFEFTFTKDVKGFAIIDIDQSIAYDVTIDPLGEPTDYKAGDTLVYSMYINDISDSRGFVLIGEDGKLHYYALRGPDPSGFTSGYKVVEVTDHPLLTVDGETPDFNPED